MTTHQSTPDQQVSRAVARLHAKMLAFILGTICGVGLFVMTVWLLIEGGANVGEHLKLLGHFFIGYDVTWPGAFIGLIYGALTGGIVGWAIGMIYNRIVNVRTR